MTAGSSTNFSVAELGWSLSCGIQFIMVQLVIQDGSLLPAAAGLFAAIQKL
jgi:hypothetical protein